MTFITTIVYFPVCRQSNDKFVTSATSFYLINFNLCISSEATITLEINYRREDPRKRRKGIPLMSLYIILCLGCNDTDPQVLRSSPKALNYTTAVIARRTAFHRTRLAHPVVVDLILYCN